MLKYSIMGNLESQRTVAIIHGIFGSGSNWRSFVQKWTQVRPDLRMVLIDLRNHGFSDHYDHNNTLMQCAWDILDLQDEIGAFHSIVGHSFGGKVALQCATVPMNMELEEVWALDSYPGNLSQESQDQSEVTTVINALRNVSIPLQKRSDLKAFLLEKGFSRMISQWMTTNLIHLEDGYHWRFYLNGIEAMLQDYFAQNLWFVLEDPSLQVDAHLVRALKSDRWDDAAIERLENLPARSKYHTLDAGHWLHVDDPEGVLQRLSQDVLPT